MTEPRASQIAARRLVELKKYRFAISYCRSAEDWAMLGRIVESLMEEYITHGMNPTC